MVVGAQIPAEAAYLQGLKWKLSPKVAAGNILALKEAYEQTIIIEN